MAYIHLTSREPGARVRVEAHKPDDDRFRHQPASVCVWLGDAAYINLTPEEAATLAAKIPAAVTEAQNIEAAYQASRRNNCLRCKETGEINCPDCSDIGKPQRTGEAA